MEHEAKRSSESDRALQLFAQAGVGLCEMSLEGKVTRANEQFCRMTGRRHEALIDRHFEDLFQHNAQAAKALEDVSTTESGESVAFAHGFPHAGGGVVWAWSSLTRIDDDGVPSALVFASIETSRGGVRAHEPASRVTAVDAHPLANHLLESVTDAIILFDPEWRCGYLNRAAETFLGTSRAQAIGRICWDLSPDFRSHSNARDAERVMRERQPHVWESQSMSSGRWMQWRTFPTPERGLVVIVHDIDDRVRLEHARQASERRFHAFAATVPAAMWTLDAEGKLEWCNEYGLSYMGLALTAASEMPVDQLIHPDDYERTKQRIAEAVESGLELRFEHRVRRSDGEYRWFFGTARPIRDDSGEITQWAGSALDIQEQRDAHQDAENARAEAEEQREQLARVFSQAPLAVAVMSGPEHVLQSANEIQQKFYGTLRRLGLSARAAFPEPEMNGVHELLDRAFSSGESIIVREQPIGWIQHDDGRIVTGFFDVVYQPLRGAGGEVEGVMSFTVDVTASVHARMSEATARAEAENAREHLRHMLAAIPTAIAVISGDKKVFELVNPAYEKLVGGRAVVGQALKEAFPQTAESGFLEILGRVMRTGEPTMLPERRVMYDRNADGVVSEAYFTSYLAPLRNRDGSISGVVTSSVEMTDHVRQREHIQALRVEAEAARAALEQAHGALEERITERTAELARANAALESEMNVRVRAEATRSELQRRLATAREDEQRRTARDLHDQVGQSLSALMLAIKTACDAETLPAAASVRLADALRLAEDLGRDIHDLATRLRPFVLDDMGLFAALRQLKNAWARRHAIKVDLQAEWLQRARLPPDVETVLYRVVQEALTNVARHAQARHVSVVVERHEGDAIAVVEDDGLGFDPNVGASGRLGLIGMRERVTLAGGVLDVESEPGHGTTIIARVPVRPSDPPVPLLSDAPGVVVK